MKINLDDIQPVNRKNKELLHKENKGIIKVDSKVLFSKDKESKKDPYHLITNHEIEVIDLLREGLTIKGIADELGVERSDVSKTLKKDHIVLIMKEIWQEQRFDLKNSMVKADKKLAEIIASGKDKDALKAIDIAYKASGRYNKAKEDEESGENYLMDLVKGNNIENVNIQINNLDE